MKPVIAFTYSSFQSVFVRIAMKLAIILSGGKPLAVVAKKSMELPNFDGLLLGGGVDISPELYHGPPKKDYPYDLERDQMESSLLEKAFTERKPILGICRGCQMLNVFRQGTLYDDIRKIDETAEYPSNLVGYIFFRKPVTLTPKTQLFECIRKRIIKVNSLHKQSIHKLGEGFVTTATERNHIIQGIENPGYPFVVGVQFHPEFLIYRRPFLRIFKQLVNKSRNRSN